MNSLKKSFRKKKKDSNIRKTDMPEIVGNDVGSSSPDIIKPPALCEKLLKKAAEELNEKPEWRNRDIQILREMVLADKKLNARTDDTFLLMFLRARKFEYDKAFLLLKRYYKIRANNAELFSRFKPSEVLNAFENNHQNMFLNRDPEGRCIFFYRAGQWDPNGCSMDDVFLANTMCHEYVIRDEETQINGIVAIIDLKNYGFYHARRVRPSDIQKVLSLLQESFPARYKGFHVINESPFFDIVFAITKPFLSHKMRSRIVLHGNDLKSLHRHFQPETLPEELGGSLPPTDNSKLVNALLDLEDEFLEDIQKYGYKTGKR